MTKVLDSSAYPTPEVRASIAKGLASSLVGGEVQTQNRMWGSDAARTDCANGELMSAAQASIMLSLFTSSPDYKPEDESEAVKLAQSAFYPENWSGFRHYGTVYNLVVAAAFLQNEIARRIYNGEDYDRKPREASQVYTGDQPKMSSAEAGGQIAMPDGGTHGN